MEENAGIVAIDISIENANQQGTEVQVAAAVGSTAAEGVDYMLAGTTLAFTPGAAATQSLSLEILPNADLSGKYLDQRCIC